MSTLNLRHTLRQRRRNITPAQREYFDFLINQHIQKSGILLRSSSIASYLANDGEPSVNYSIQNCAKKALLHYLPVISKKRLKFAQYSFGGPLTSNAFNIPEPLTKHFLPARLLSSILIPLVGFDKQGNRLGMGGGYYDRTLNFMSQTACRKKPLLIGIAYSLQEVDSIQSRHWDIPLDAVITELGITCFSTRAKQFLRIS